MELWLKLRRHIYVFSLLEAKFEVCSSFYLVLTLEKNARLVLYLVFCLMDCCNPINRVPVRIRLKSK